MSYGRRAPGERRCGGRGPGERRIRSERRDGRRVLSGGRARACRGGRGPGRRHRGDTRRRRLPHAGGAGDDPQSRSLWHGARAGGVRQRRRPRWSRCRHLLAVRASPSPARLRTERGVGHDARGGAARSSLPSARPGGGLSARVPAREARQLVARDGRGGALGASAARGSTRSARASS